MEDNYNECFLKLKEDTQHKFAETDTILRSGTHIQDHDSQYDEFLFIKDNYASLEYFYKNLYQVQLCTGYTVDKVYYYLESIDGQRSRLKKKNLDQKQTLFAIFLYTLHKVEKRFSIQLTKDEVEESLRNHPQMWPHIQRLFLGTETEITNTSDKTILRWIDESLRELKNIGWIHYDEDNDNFEILPAYERITFIYRDVINNIDEIKTSAN